MNPVIILTKQTWEDIAEFVCYIVRIILMLSRIWGFRPNDESSKYLWNTGKRLPEDSNLHVICCYNPFFVLCSIYLFRRVSGYNSIFRSPVRITVVKHWDYYSQNIYER